MKYSFLNYLTERFPVYNMKVKCTWELNAVLIKLILKILEFGYAGDSYVYENLSIVLICRSNCLIEVIPN